MELKSSQMDSVELFVPESHKDKTLDNFDWLKYAKIKNMVMKVLDEKTENGLFLFGDPGVGKTHLAVGMFKSFVNKDYVIGSDVMFVQWSDLITEIADVLKDGAIPEVVIDKLTNVRVLIIDDIRPGWGRVWCDMVKRVIEKVYEKQVKWIATANVEDVNDLVSKWQIEDYWLSRMKEMVAFVKIVGEDRRGKNV